MIQTANACSSALQPLPLTSQKGWTVVRGAAHISPSPRLPQVVAYSSVTAESCPPPPHHRDLEIASIEMIYFFKKKNFKFRFAQVDHLVIHQPKAIASLGSRLEVDLI